MMSNNDLSLFWLTPWSTIAWPLLAGMVLGLLFYSSLWFSTKKIVQSRKPLAWLLAGFLLRMAMVLPAFYWVSDAHWQNLFSCLVGFISARLLVIRVTSKRYPTHTAQTEAKHAS